MYLLRSGRQVALGGILLASFGRGGTAVPSTTAPRNLYPPADERLPWSMLGISLRPAWRTFTVASWRRGISGARGRTRSPRAQVKCWATSTMSPHSVRETAARSFSI